MNRSLTYLGQSGLAMLWLVAASPAAAQVLPGYPVGAPPVLVQGTSVAASLRNAVQVTADQCRRTSQFAQQMGRRVYTGSYQMENLAADYQALQLEFQDLRLSFNLVAQQAQQLPSPRAANAAAELQAGLDIISEAFAPVQQEIQMATVNRDTVASMCRVLQEALQVWDRELKKKSSRLGLIR